MVKWIWIIPLFFCGVLARSEDAFMLGPAIEESLDISNRCCDTHCLDVIVSRSLLKVVSSIKRTKPITMKKSSDPTDLVRKVLE